MTFVFVSYKRKNIDLAQQVKTWITDKAGLAYWIDKDNIYSGEHWEPAIDQAIWDCFALVVIMTKLAKESDQVTYEWIFALGAGKHVIPLRVDLELDELHPRMQKLNVLDFNNSDDQKKLIEDLQLYEKNARSSVYIPPNTPKDIGQLAEIAFNSGELIEVTRDCIQRLAQIEHPDARTILIDGLQHHDPTKRLQVLYAMDTLQFADLRALDNLVQLLTTYLGNRAYQVVNILSRFGEPAIDRLVPYLDSDHKVIRQYVCMVLGKIGGSRTLPGLTNSLKDTSPNVRYAAAEALGEMGDNIAIGPIEAALNTEEDFTVQSCLQEALKKIRAKR